MNKKPFLLLILDGFGYRAPAADNAISLANTPNWDRIWSTYPRTTIQASENYVGLPHGQMGNSEVGHLNIGAGRIVYQELTRISLAIENKTFYQNDVLRTLLTNIQKQQGTLHVLGLVSDGGVHAHDSHIAAMLELASQFGIHKVRVHAFLDGRDTPPRSAATYLAQLDAACAAQPNDTKIASLIGRYYAMDRDKRWDRLAQAYDLITSGQATYCAPDAQSGLQAAYDRNENDEFVQATVIGTAERMHDGDGVIFMNFRADRARQLTQAFLDVNFTGFERQAKPRLSGFTTLTSYGEEFDKLPLSVAFKPELLKNTLGEYLATHQKTQLRIAETEKYAHVTYFFNGGAEEPFAAEDRILVPSPQVATYDLKPEMSADEVTEKLEAAILSQHYDVLICNLANGDMVGHTGKIDAAIQAVETLDRCIARLEHAILQAGGQMLITADHGNVDTMLDEVSGQPSTAHSLNPVPLVYIGNHPTLTFKANGKLADLAPTLLHLINLPVPPEMTGSILI